MFGFGSVVAANIYLNFRFILKCVQSEWNTSRNREELHRLRKLGERVCRILVRVCIL